MQNRRKLATLTNFYCKGQKSTFILFVKNCPLYVMEGLKQWPNFYNSDGL